LFFARLKKGYLMSLRFFAALFLLLASFSTQAEVLRLQSTEQQTMLLELFTSEGCSSCPPADRWLSGLKEDPRLWQQLIPVAFHVDYWDYIGWPDRFARAEYGQRQSAHARNWGNGRVYTPGLVQNGDEWSGWFRNRELVLDGPNTVGTLQLSIDANDCQVQFAPTGTIPPQLELNIAVLGFDLESEVNAGENRGRQLQHDFVVLGHKRIALQASATGFTAQTELPILSADAPRRAVAAWVSAPQSSRPLQAVGGWL
jgi:hypothetical protein